MPDAPSVPLMPPDIPLVELHCAVRRWPDCVIVNVTSIAQCFASEFPEIAPVKVPATDQADGGGGGGADDAALAGCDEA